MNCNILLKLKVNEKKSDINAHGFFFVNAEPLFFRASRYHDFLFRHFVKNHDIMLSPL